jgi:hypothetical protein
MVKFKVQNAKCKMQSEKCELGTVNCKLKILVIFHLQGK